MHRPSLFVATLACGLALLLATLLATCGGGDAEQESVHLLSPRQAQLRYPRPEPGTPGPFHAQEIWVTWRDPAYEDPFHRIRTREQALALAEDLYRQVKAGAELGPLARAHSHAPGGRIHGWAVLFAVRQDPDLRDRVLVGTRIGELTPLVEWRGGFWFARRIEQSTGERYRAQFEAAMGLRARARAIVFHHNETHLNRDESKGITRTMARGYIQGVFDALQRGEKFEGLAREYSLDEASAQRGGLLHASFPLPGEDPSWLHWGDIGYPQDLLDVVLETGEVGRVHPQPLDTSWGFIAVEVLERFRIDKEKKPAGG